MINKEFKTKLSNNVADKKASGRKSFTTNKSKYALKIEQNVNLFELVKTI